MQRIQEQTPREFLTVEQCDRILQALLEKPGPTETVPLAGAAGRVLRAAVQADRDQPPFDRIVLDGIAIATTSWEAGRRKFRLAGCQKAGAPPLVLEDRETALEVMTGASLPEGCDCVIPKEDLEFHDGWVAFREGIRPPRPGLNVHARGVDAVGGDTVLAAGLRMGPAELAVAATVGAVALEVSRPPRIAVTTTGDECVDIEGPVLPHQIRRSNGPSLAAALARAGYPVQSLRHAGDDEEELLRRLHEGFEESDVQIWTGGVSQGRFDLLPGLMESSGVRKILHRVRQKPGKPMWFGLSGDDKPVFALPGNPVSALICLYRYVLPALDRMAGYANVRRARKVQLKTRGESGDSNLTRFLPVRLDQEAEREFASVIPWNGSGDIFSLVGSDGFVELGPGPMVAAGAWPGLSVDFHPWT